MKYRSLCLLLLAVLLAGCARSKPSTYIPEIHMHTKPTSAPETEPPTDEPAPEATEPSEETTAPTEPVKPVLYPESEYDFGPEVQLDGFWLRTYQRGDYVYLRADDLSSMLTDFSCRAKKGNEALRITYGNQTSELPLVAYGKPTDGADAVRFNDPYAVLLPLKAVTELPGLAVLEDEEQDQIYISQSLDAKSVSTGKTVPVLMYHCISDDIFGIPSLFVSPDSFREQLLFLQERGYEPIFFSDLSHLKDYKKPIIITLDDGYENNYQEMYPIIQELGIPVTIFMISDFFGRERYITADQAWEMSSSGLVSIQSHTADHIKLDEADEAAQEKSMSRSRLAIARATGKVPYVLSYPEGRYTAQTQKLAEKYYDLAVKTGNSLWVSESNLFAVSRLSMLRDTTLEDLAAMLGEA